MHWPHQLRHHADMRVVAIDLPGHGESGGETCTSVGEFAAAIVRFLDGLGAEKAILGGHSMGGAITQTFALEYPDRAAGIVLVGTGARLRVSPQILDGVKRDFAGTANLIVEWSFGPGAPGEMLDEARKQLMAVNADMLYSDYAACDKFDAIGRVSQIKAPTLIIGGLADKLTPEKYSRYLAEQIAGAQLRLSDGAGHMVMLERAENVTEAIKEFVLVVHG
jgi:pimeloyl-ACP methyl ester carboxylesterase